MCRSILFIGITAFILLCLLSLLSFLLMSFRSVAACEATVKKLYSLLGWEYKDTDSDADDDDDITGKVKK